VLTVRDVLFATDFSEASRLAGQTAAAVARHFGARLHVLHVVPPVTDPTPAPESLRAVVADLDAGGPVVTAIASGRVAARIVDYTRRNGIDLIVLGTHGRTGVSHALLGSVAEAVIRRAPCRVLTVPVAIPSPARAAVPAEEAEETISCAVCGAASRDDLICEPCRAKIRGEALDHKLREERAGRR
jgi:nucleotide-binding universal stress UspA family protein